ncbi:ester cyclase [Ideonella azotifigens]|uniref:Ester cyclase n=1 Tax=Ideonella azotifigens TaxID=513160 RepID=A0ABP3USA3_9BURK|nr:ester cyclase [Ideonella azotifigens]MCD2341861.1 ester cyclase [Ideonella azotifigens]
MPSDIPLSPAAAVQPNGLSAAEQRAIETLYRAFNEQDPALVHEATTPDWQDIPLGPGQAPGPAGLGPVIAMFAQAFPDVRITVQEMFGHQGRAAVRARITGTHRGEFFGIAPTGKPIDVVMHEVHHLRDGRISHTWHLEDWFGMLGQLSAWPPQA